MKTTLTKEQSDHLFELGVPRDKAKGAVATRCMGESSYSDAFNIDDLLTIIPNEIDASNFYMIGVADGYDVGYSHYKNGELYSMDDELDTIMFHSEHLIDALYELVVWLIKIHILEFK